MQKETGMPVRKQRLIYAGKLMGDEQALSSYAVESGSCLQVLLRLQGGMTDEPDPEFLTGSRLMMDAELPSVFRIDNFMQCLGSWIFSTVPRLQCCGS